jgi:hypothetical protein
MVREKTGGGRERPFQEIRATKNQLREELLEVLSRGPLSEDVELCGRHINSSSFPERQLVAPVRASAVEEELKALQSVLQSHRSEDRKIRSRGGGRK